MARTVRPPGPRQIAIGENARAVRERKRLTRAQVAEEMGVSLDVVANLELGRSIMSVEQLLDLAAALGVTSTRLLRDLPAA